MILMDSYRVYVSEMVEIFHTLQSTFWITWTVFYWCIIEVDSFFKGPGDFCVSFSSPQQTKYREYF